MVRMAESSLWLEEGATILSGLGTGCSARDESDVIS